MPWGEPAKGRSGQVGKSYRAWEDGHWVTLESPDAGWYMDENGQTLAEDFTGAYVCNPKFRERAYGAGFGVDWGNFGTFFSGFIDGWSGSGKGGGSDMASGFISAGGGQTNAATKALKEEIITKRNAWLTERGIPIPGASGSAGRGEGIVQQFRAWLGEKL
jgi:hypothetical protein